MATSSTTRASALVVSEATWLRPPASSTIWVLVGLPFTTKVPVNAAAMLPAPSPIRSVSVPNGSPYLAAYARAVAALWARMTRKIDGRGAQQREGVVQSEGRQPEGGQPAGNVAEHADPVGGQVGHPADDDRADHGDQCPRDPAGDPPGGHHHRDDAQGHGDGEALGLGQRGDRLARA